MPLLRTVFASSLIAFALAGGPACAGGATPEERAAIETVIQKQMDALAQDDAESAFGYASPNIRQMFGDADRFMGMVKQSYPPVYRHRDASFMDLKEGTTEVVAITGEDGRHWIAIYQMIKDEAGAWRINGCQLIEDPDAHV